VTTHAQAYVRHPSFELAAAMSPTPAHLHAFQERWHIPRGYLTLEDMLRDDALDVISLCSPNEQHVAQAVEILTSPHRPRVLFMEKPVCGQPHDLDRLVALARHTSVGVLVNHTRRFDPAYRRLAHLVRSGTLGALVSGRCLYYGGWFNIGVHLLDTLRMLFSEDIEVVSASPAGHGRGADSNFHVGLRIGCASVIAEAFDESCYQLFEWDLRFALGRVQLSMDGNIAVERVEVNGLDERVLAPAEGFPLQGLDSPLLHAVGAIEAYLRGQDPWGALGVDLASASQTMKLLWEAQEMAREEPARHGAISHAAAR